MRRPGRNGSLRLGDLAEAIGARIEGAPKGGGAAEDLQLVGVATLDSATADDLSFFANVSYRRAFDRTAAGAVIVSEKVAVADDGPSVVLRAPNPYLAWSRSLWKFFPATRPEPGISPRAEVAEDARIGEGAHIAPFAVIEAGAAVGAEAVIGPHVVVGAGAYVGDRTELRPGAVLYPGVRVGADCLIHSGAVVGADGFGFANEPGKHHKVAQIGSVRVEDDVELGANTCVDRGALTDTVIGAGSKLDDLIMIGHGVEMGRGTLMAAQVGIGGSTVIGDFTMWGGQAGAVGHLKLGDHLAVAAGGSVYGDFPGKGMISGVPARNHAEWLKQQAAARRVPELRKQVRDLMRRVAELERTSDSD